MRSFHQLLSVTISACVLAAAAHAQVPASNDTSDTNQNTGSGTGALGGPNPSRGPGI
jgi:hypothetical protein